MKNTTLQRLNKQQIAEIYHTYMETDFPVDELRPLEEFMERLDRGIYECLGFFEEGDLRAYSYFVKDEAEQTILLDFLAVCPEYRGGGYGGSFMREMAEYYASYRGILIECESEQTAADEKELEVRTRRMAFYVKNGCVRTLTRSCLFRVEFDILYLPLADAEMNGESEIALAAAPDYEKPGHGVPEVAEQMKHMYALLFAGEGSQEHYSVWNRSSRIKQVWGWTGECIPLCHAGKLDGNGAGSPGTSAVQPSHVEKSSLTAQPSLLAALGFADLETLPRIISLVGGGGKTTTMYQLADELAEHGLRVLVTTSTHIVKPQNGQVAEICDVRELQEVEWNGQILTAGTPVEGGVTMNGTPGLTKLSRPQGLGDQAEMERLLELADVILIEADGAKQKPVKVPRDGEPVLISQTGLVIACAGLSAIGKTFGEACFRFAEQGQWLMRKDTDLVESDDVALILVDERGSRKELDGRYYRIVLNQADRQTQRQTAEKVIRMLPVTMQRDCVVTSYYR